MERILSDFRRHRAGMLIICTVIAVGFSAAVWIPLIFSGGWAEWFRYVWIAGAAVITAVLVSLLVKAFAEMLYFAPKKLAAQPKLRFDFE